MMCNYTNNLLPSTWHTVASAPIDTSRCNHTICLVDKRSPGPFTSMICERKTTIQHISFLHLVNCNNNVYTF